MLIYHTYVKICDKSKQTCVVRNIVKVVKAQAFEGYKLTLV